MPDEEACGLIRDVLVTMNLYSPREFRWVWDTASMFYFYHSRRKSLDPEARKRGWTGYTGILQEMIVEVPAKGLDRLTRKLSLDIYFFIPYFIEDTELQHLVRSVAWDTAKRHGRPVPPPSKSQADAGRRNALSWWDWFSLGSLFGLALPREHLEDEEREGEMTESDTTMIERQRLGDDIRTAGLD